MHNKCSFIGNLGRDPEIRSFQNGGRVCSFSIAVTEKWKDKNTGERKEATEWIPISIFTDGLVGVAERYLRKGSKIFVEGKWKTRKWTDKDNNDRYSTECVLQGPNGILTMLDGKDGGQSTRKPDGSQGHASQPVDDLDDDIPF